MSLALPREWLWKAPPSTPDEIRYQEENDIMLMHSAAKNLSDKDFSILYNRLVSNGKMLKLNMFAHDCYVEMEFEKYQTMMFDIHNRKHAIDQEESAHLPPDQWPNVPQTPPLQRVGGRPVPLAAAAKKKKAAAPKKKAAAKKKRVVAA